MSYGRGSLESRIRFPPGRTAPGIVIIDDSTSIKKPIAASQEILRSWFNSRNPVFQTLDKGKTMSKAKVVSLAKDFVPALVSKLPKDVMFIKDAPDGAYLVAQDQEAQGQRQSNGYNSRPAMKAGTLIISTENGHLYTLNGSDGLQGIGKNRNGASIGPVLVQRVNIDVTAKGYKAAPKPVKKVRKKKVVKKKVVKKKVRRASSRRW